MKIFSLMLMFSFASVAKAQQAKPTDICKLIKTEISDDKLTFNYASPYDADEKPLLKITRNYSIDKENPYDNFNIIFQVYGDIDNIYTTSATGDKVEKEEKKIVIEFDDHSKITDDTTSINHDFSEDKTQSVRYIYFPVTDKNVNDFLTKKIVKFSLAGYEQIVPTDSTNSFQKYLLCIKSVH